MRSLARDVTTGAVASDPGGPAAGADAPDAATTRATPTATASALLERLTRVCVEEVHLRDVDADRDVLRDLQLHVRRILRHEVRAGRDDALAAGHLLLVLVLLAFAHGRRVDPEVDDRLAAERLDELDLGVEERQLGAFL